MCVMEFPDVDDNIYLDDLDDMDMSSNVNEVKPSSSNLVKRERKNVENRFEESVNSNSIVMRSDSQHVKEENTEVESRVKQDSFPCSEYEKEKPELKGPITTFSQYKEYVQEYRHKHGSYISLHKILEDFRAEFKKLGEELENAKRNGHMDRHEQISKQIKETYLRYGSIHKRQKKIFIVLHEELKNINQRIKDFVASKRK
ncbi:uncharacterized protein [Cicer arietinum]|uniref:Uncharacterized protein LOC101499214 n=1 Tax=Cicer arietinum TaxID=3827 RepID=A0A1S2YV08_CICAR|nr:uncharacterized protein LOC101499214 [Cicer arietinum]